MLSLEAFGLCVRKFPCHLPGLCFLQFGWFGFNAGSSLHADGYGRKHAHCHCAFSGCISESCWSFFLLVVIPDRASERPPKAHCIESQPDFLDTIVMLLLASAATNAFFTTNTASAAAMLAWVLCDLIRTGNASCIGACTGAVIGLVAITPGA